ncbi:hypothetical protein ACHAXS_008277 [Conticribra weissflogii]
MGSRALMELSAGYS